MLLGCCLARAFFYGKADKVPKSISRIIVVPAGKLGDVVCTTPVLRAIRKHFPNVEIILAGPVKLHQPLLSDSGLADKYLELNQKMAVTRIKECRADVALVTGPSFEATALLYLTGISLVVAPIVRGGFSPYETRSYKVLQRFIKTFPYHMGEYAPRERLRVLEPLGIICDDTKKHLGFSSIADEKANQFFVDNSIDIKKDFVVGISPSAGNKIKEWPEERFAKLADYIALKYKGKVIIIGGPKDKEKVGKTRSYLNPQTKITESTDFNVDELKALMAKLHLFISVDTGPIYIAEAFDIPTVDITGPIDEKEQPPQGLLHRNVVPPSRSRPELFVLNARSYNKEEALRQVKSITVSLVEDEIDLLMRDLNRKKSQE